MPDCLDCGARWPEGTLTCPDDGSVLVDASSDPYIGRRIGSYVVSRCLGRGGMGAVYEAEHPTIGGRVAIKFLHRRYTNDAQIVDRFFNEARAVNIIGHDNIVRVIDFNRADDGSPYFIMEFLEGQALTGLVDTPQPLSVTGPIVLQVAEGLLAAHEKGIVHRDLKPDNIFLVTRGRRANFVKIVDFGIAKLQGGDGVIGHTQTGMVMGTAQYMSPEQAGGETNRISPASDVYSLGIIMFQLATGRLPFDGSSFGEVLVGHLVRPPPDPRTIEPSIPESYAALILRCLQKKPEDRFTSMDELYETLGGVLDELGLSRDLPIAYTGARSDPEAAKVERVKRASAPPWFPPSINDEEDGYTAVTTPAPVGSTPSRKRASSPDGTVLLPSSHVTGTPVPSAPAPRQSRVGLVAVVAAVVAMAGVGIVWGITRSAPIPIAQTPVETPPSGPRLLNMVVITEPEGARVNIRQNGSRHRGTSPFSVALVENLEAAVTFELEGYEPHRTTLIPTRAGEVRYELEKTPEPPPQPVATARATPAPAPPPSPPSMENRTPPPAPKPAPDPVPKERATYGDDIMPIDF